MNSEPRLLVAGVPVPPISGWKRLGRWVCPWLKTKVNRGERYLRTQMEKEQALAEKSRAEARHHDADAAKAFAEAERIRAESRHIDASTALAALNARHALQKSTCVSNRADATVDAILEKIREGREGERRLNRVSRTSAWRSRPVRMTR